MNRWKGSPTYYEILETHELRVLQAKKKQKLYYLSRWVRTYYGDQQMRILEEQLAKIEAVLRSRNDQERLF